MDGTRSFLEDVWYYACRMKRFTRVDWNVYFAWIGMMLGLLFSILSFCAVGWWHGVQYPAYVWNVPVGTFIFIVAIAFDTIGHRTAYKEELKKGEALVHHITIAAGVSSVFLLCLAYRYPDAFRIPALSLTALTIFYSAIDEAMHWRRYLSGHSDRIEMWSHFFIFVGHTIMMLSWYYWFDHGYAGVAETLVYF
jgi:hypothetical protein